MKKQFIYLAFALPFSAAAQSLSPTVVASAGNHASAGNVQLSYTVGEVAVTTLSGGSNILTQGFNQPIEVSTGITEGVFEGSIKVYPNPAAHELHIEANTSSEAIAVVLTDMNGRVAITTTISGEATEVINVAQLAAAPYQLTLIGSENAFRKTHQIIINR